MTTYEAENNELFKNFIKNYKLNKKTKLELIVSPICNTKCSYCYYKNYSEFTYPLSCADPKNILNNLRKLIDWDKENGFQFEDVDIFSGEFFNLPFYREILEILLKETPYYIIIPTNSTFAFSEDKTEEIQNILDSYPKRIHLSLSIDGYYLDNQNRAMRNGKKYDDEFYDRLFRFSSKNKFGFHPMIHSKGINLWPENYMWFIEKIMHYYNLDEKEASKKMFLLEVRNPDWSREELIDLKSFIEFLLEHNYPLYKDNEDFIKNYLLNKSVSMFTRIPSTNHHGITCSIQHSFSVRLGDLSIVPCHRTAYQGYNMGKINFDQKDFSIDYENPFLYMMIASMDFRKGIKCIDCPINMLCVGQCLGNNIEVNKDPLIPADNVCNLEWTIVTSVIDFLNKKGCMEDIYNMYNINYNNQQYAYFKYKKLKQLDFIRRNIDEFSRN